MSDWQERITRDTASAIKAEHHLRYHAAAPLILAGGAWVDLGCGNGIAAASALGDVRPRRAVLVDLDGKALAAAAATLGVGDTAEITGDLTDRAVLGRISDALLDADGPAVVTCFEVIEHLATFVPIIEWAGSLVRERDATFLLSVPNDAFWAIQNPHHQTAWSAGAFEELQRLLPAQRTLLRQVSIAGSALTHVDVDSETQDLRISVGGTESVATHFLVAFGPLHDRFKTAAMAIQTNMLEQRRWERERESNLAFSEAMVADQAEQLRTRVKQLQKNTAEFTQWREYIHTLERDLGLPLSGGAPTDADGQRGDTAPPLPREHGESA